MNTGSSSVKCAIYEIGDGHERRVGSSNIEGSAPGAVLDALDDVSSLQDELTAIGHRVVHGGPHHHRPAMINSALVADLRAAVPFAPLHQPGALDTIEVLARRYPRLPQVACFDTAFHHGMPEVASRLPLPSELADQGVRRYGFHGLSYEYIAATLGTDSLRRAVFAHLGGGSSLVAVRDGQPLATTMGLTPAGGLVMGTRSGDLDPGVLIYLAREQGYDTERLERLVNSQAGLLGLSGTSDDMRTLLTRRDAADQHAALAIDIYTTALRMQIGAYTALLGGLDTLVFTGGIGAHAPAVRAEACADLMHLGVAIDQTRNATNATIISVQDSPATVHVLETNEDIMIARHAYSLLTNPAQ